MAIHGLTHHFRAFFSNINPADSYEQIPANEHTNVRRLLEDHRGPAGTLEVERFLQGSYRNDTSIHSINDVDIVALCTALRQPGTGTGPGWGRDAIFDAFARALAQDPRYRGKVQFGPASMCVKLDLQPNQG